MVRQVEAAPQDVVRCAEGDLVVIVAGSPPALQAAPTPYACTASATPSNPEKPGIAGHRGISRMMVDRGMPGFSRGRNLDKLGMHA